MTAENRCLYVDHDTYERCTLREHFGDFHRPPVVGAEADLRAVRAFVARVAKRPAACCCEAMQDELREMEATP